MEGKFNRPVLDRILCEAIPDLEHDPSPLHEKLLMLPWTDIFTTNYDTLLERTQSKDTIKKYDIVVNIKSLLHSKRPRICKLHGSFSHEAPSSIKEKIVITEEDYRGYPTDFDPFVNTVKQALLENTFCLIGFSANDPNFKKWIGWLRDKMGEENICKIYMINLSNSFDDQTKFFERNNIVPINIVPDHLSKDSDQSQIYYDLLDQSIEELLSQSTMLSSKKSEYNNLEWPKDNEIELKRPENSKSTQLSQLISKWKNQRLSYPGWVVVPEDRRRVLWHHTQEWISFLESKSDIVNFEVLEFVYELHWRMEKCLCPIPSNHAELFEEIIDKDFVLVNDKESAESINTSPEDMTYQILDKKCVKKMIRELQIWMLRYYREEGLLGKWEDLHRKLQLDLDNFSKEDEAHFQYERVLHALFQLNLPEVKKILSKWESL